MSRTLTLLFRRDPSRDRQSDVADFAGYQILWPDGKPVAIGLDAFCKHGQRLFGLGKRLAGCPEKLIKMVCFPLEGREDDLNIERTGRSGRIHFMDGTPTTATFELDRDEPKVLDWLGLSTLNDGERQWFDLAATELDTLLPAAPPRARRMVCEVS